MASKPDCKRVVHNGIVHEILVKDLVAAAPVFMQTLEALEEAIGETDPFDPDLGALQAIIKPALAIIAKITGRKVNPI